ncbi:MAG: hypothetical protein ABIO24_02295 [Saprospiraceae bacterium]
MTVPIQFNQPEDFKLVEPLLRLFKEQGVRVQVAADLPSVQAKSGKKPQGVAKRLPGILHLPEGFDYKIFMKVDC